LYITFFNSPQFNTIAIQKLLSSQYDFWLPEFPSLRNLINSITPHNQTYLTKLIIFFNKFNINFHPILKTQITGENTPIMSYIENPTKTTLRSLKNKCIIFMDQITSLDGTYLLTFKEVKHTNASQYKGPIPSWFKSLEESAISLDYNRRLLMPLTRPSIQPLNHKQPKISTNNHYYRPKNEWTVFWHPETNVPIYGKTIEQVNNEGSISITQIEHYIPYAHPNEITSNLTPRKRTAILQLCKGCNLHTPYHHDLRPKCVVMNHTSTLHKFKVHNKNYTPPQRLSIPRKHKLIFPTTPLLTLTTKAYNIFQNATYPITSHTTLTHSHSHITPSLSNPNNNNSIPNNRYFLKKILQGSPDQINLLLEISSLLMNYSQFTFYTDGALIGLQTSACRMGFGWIEPRFNITFKGSCIFNPFSTKSESYAILTVLLVVPNNSSIDIYTDSQNSIHNYNTFLNPLFSHRKQLNHNNHLLWTFIMEIIKDKILTIMLHKVKAHLNDLYNDMADELATQGLNTEPINLHINAHARNSVLLPIWNSMGIIDTNPRKWIKKVLQARIFNNFLFNSDFNTIRNIFSNTDINWEYTSL
jgi:ribonuclease HI